MFVVFLRTSNTYLYDEFNMIEHTWTTDYWEERCHLVRPLGLIAWGGLGRLWVSLRASWEGLGGLLGDLGASWDDLVSPAPSTGLGVNCPKTPSTPYTQLNILSFAAVL